MSLSVAICIVQMAPHFISSLLVFCFMGDLSQSVFAEQWPDVEALDSDSQNTSFFFPSRDARDSGNFIPLKNIGGSNRKTSDNRLSGARKKTRPGPGSAFSDPHYFLPTPLALMSSPSGVNQSEDSLEPKHETSGTPKATGSNSYDADNQYASGPISLQNFLRYRNESISPFRLESLTADHLKGVHNSSSESSSEDHVKDIFDRFKTNNSEFLPTSTEQKESDARDPDDNNKESVSETPMREKSAKHSVKQSQVDGNGLSNSFQPQSFPFQHFQPQQTPRSPPHQGKSNLIVERNHSLKDGSQNGFPKSGVSKLKRGKERSPPHLLTEKKDMDSDPKEDSGSRFPDESGPEKPLLSGFEMQEGTGAGRKAPKQKNRSPFHHRNPSEALFTDSLDTRFSTPPAHHSGPNKHNLNEQEDENSDKEDAFSSKHANMHGDSVRENEVPGNGNLHRQASGARNYPPLGGYEMPPYQPFMPPYPFPMPMPFPPPPPPPITCCKTYYPSPPGVKPQHKAEFYPHASSNEIDSVTPPGASAKSDSSSAETTGYPMIGYEIPGETFCYQEPMIPSPLLWKQMKLQKLLYPFILKKRLFFG